MQLFSIWSSYQFHVKRRSHITRWDTIASTHCRSSARTRTHTNTRREVLLINFHLLSPLWIGVSASHRVPLLLIAVKCSESIKPIESALLMMMMSGGWERQTEPSWVSIWKIPTTANNYNVLLALSFTWDVTESVCKCMCVCVCV